MSHPLYEKRREVTPYAAVVLCDNPSMMTLDGTNTWLLKAPGGSGTVVVDPGPADDAHLDAIIGAADGIELTLITHRHDDHTGGAAAFAERTGAPIRALDPEHCHGGDPLRDGEVVEAAGLRITVVATPGHTSDSVSFLVESPGEPAAMLTGDTILGRGTTVIAHPDGNMADYLASLSRLEAYGDIQALPAHGAEIASLAGIARQYAEHRAQRLQQVRDALDVLGADATARQVVEHVYTDVPQENWKPAELSVMAQLEYLRG